VIAKLGEDGETSTDEMEVGRKECAIRYDLRAKDETVGAFVRAEVGFVETVVAHPRLSVAPDKVGHLLEGHVLGTWHEVLQLGEGDGEAGELCASELWGTLREGRGRRMRRVRGRRGRKMAWGVTVFVLFIALTGEGFREGSSLETSSGARVIVVDLPVPSIHRSNVLEAHLLISLSSFSAQFMIFIMTMLLMLMMLLAMMASVWVGKVGVRIVETVSVVDAREGSHFFILKVDPLKSL
jgi:hypothetical protein